MSQILSNEQQIELIKQYQNKDLSDEIRGQAFTALWLSVEKYAIKLLRNRFNSYFTNEPDEMLQAGRIALMEALENYDPNKGMLTTRLNSFLLHAGVDVSRNNISSYYNQQITKIRKSINKLNAQGITVNDYNISEDTGLSLYTVKQCQDIMNHNQMVRIDSLEAPDDFLMTFEQSPEEQHLATEENEILHYYIDKLPDNQKKIIKLYFGFDSVDKSGITVTQIANELSLDKNTVCRLRRKAMSFIKDGLKKSGVFDEYSRRSQELGYIDAEIPLFPIENPSLQEENLMILNSIDIDF